MRWKIYKEICLLSCFYLLQPLLLFACLSLHWILVSGHFPQTAPIAGLCKNVGVRFREHIAWLTFDDLYQLLLCHFTELGRFLQPCRSSCLRRSRNLSYISKWPARVLLQLDGEPEDVLGRRAEGAVQAGDCQDSKFGFWRQIWNWTVAVQVRAHVKKDDGRMQAYGWSLPAKQPSDSAAASTPSTASGGKSPSEETQVCLFEPKVLWKAFFCVMSLYVSAYIKWLIVADLSQ